MGERARPQNLPFFVINKFFSRQKKPIFSLFVYPIKRGARGNHLRQPKAVEEQNPSVPASNSVKR
jgi:hypothetical protein